MTDLSYAVRRSRRARHARVEVTPAGVELVVPSRMALRRAEALVHAKRPWIERTLRRMREAQSVVPAVRLANGGELPYLGVQLPLRVREEPDRVRAHVARRGSGVTALVPAPAEAHLRPAIERWYRRRAREEVAARLAAAAARVGASYGALSIRGQRSRWASCSSSGSMSFNWRLLLAPPEILDYVVEHEVAHLEVLDHSDRFWKLLARRCPEYRERERWLRRYGPALHL